MRVWFKVWVVALLAFFSATEVELRPHKPCRALQRRKPSISRA